MPEEELKNIMKDYKKVSEEKTVPFLKENCATLQEALTLMGSVGNMLESHMHKYQSKMTVKELGIVNDLKKINPQTEMTRKLIELIIPFEKLNFNHTLAAFSGFIDAFTNVAKDKYGKENIQEVDKLLAK